jgi:ABC-2 type transport system ATP-binding protein
MTKVTILVTNGTYLKRQQLHTPFITDNPPVVILALLGRAYHSMRGANFTGATMLDVSNLHKSYRGGVRALDCLSLEIKPGMFGLLGPNGAGKSTLMRTLAGLQLPDGGSIFLDGIDVLANPLALRKQLGYLPQSFGAYPYISCRALLRHMAVLKGLPDNMETARQVDRLIELTNLEPHASKPVTAFSGGMRQRFGIAQALLGDPALLILDEPTAGLDPEERLRLYNLLSSLSSDRIVLLSTHIVDDVEQLCREVAIINSGRIIARGDTERLVAELEMQVWQGMAAANEESGALLLNTTYLRGVPQYRYHCESNPGAGFERVLSSLQDRYFLELRRDTLAATC